MTTCCKCNLDLRQCNCLINWIDNVEKQVNKLKETISKCIDINLFHTDRENRETWQKVCSNSLNTLNNKIKQMEERIIILEKPIQSGRMIKFEPMFLQRSEAAYKDQIEYLEEVLKKIDKEHIAALNLLNRTIDQQTEQHCKDIKMIELLEFTVKNQQEHICHLCKIIDSLKEELKWKSKHNHGNCCL